MSSSQKLTEISLTNSSLTDLKNLCRTLHPYKIRDFSKKVKEGDIFVAVKGTSHDGHQFIPEVCTQKPQALVVEQTKLIPSSYKGKVFQVPSTQQVLPLLLNEYYNFPSEKMFVIGVTGTNGKTTTTHLIEHLLSKSGWKTGVIGTINHHVQNQTWKSQLTTPSAIELQERFSLMKKMDVCAVAVEVSSIALHQHRVDGTQFNLAIFTNFTQDHLDYHKNMENYFKAKTRLFQLAQTYNHCVALFNIDDPKIKEFSKKCRMPFLSYGSDKEAHFRYEITKATLTGVEFYLTHKQESYTVHLPLIGEHNVSNAVAALAAAFIAGFSLENTIKHLKSFPGVRGRLEPLSSKKPIHIFIDYAHTPSALEQALKTLRTLKKPSQKLIVVFGCGGNRDAGKREQMGHIASQYAHQIVLTSDNPRNEDPNTIIQDILKGVSTHKNNVFICPERKEGIKKGLKQAQPNDIVLIAGKGHERVQIIGNNKFPFDDKLVAGQFL